MKIFILLLSLDINVLILESGWGSMSRIGYHNSLFVIIFLLSQFPPKIVSFSNKQKASGLFVTLTFSQDWFYSVPIPRVCAVTNKVRQSASLCVLTVLQFRILFFFYSKNLQRASPSWRVTLTLFSTSLKNMLIKIFLFCFFLTKEVKKMKASNMETI